MTTHLAISNRRLPLSQLALLSMLVLGSLLVLAPHPVAGLRCYICNSIDEPDCASNPPELLAADCTLGRQTGGNTIAPVANPVACWSQHQEAKSVKVVVRHCAGFASTNDGADLTPECYDRVGSKGVRSKYCKCVGDLCNAAARVGSASGVALFAAVAVAAVAGRGLF